jgi:hypothetical protein
MTKNSRNIPPSIQDHHTRGHPLKNIIQAVKLHQLLLIIVTNRHELTFCDSNS